MSGRPVDEIVRIASDLVRIPSVSDSGGVYAAVDFVAAWLKERGVKARIAEYGKGAPVAIAEAGSGKRSILLNGHVDVVPAGDPSRWKHDPFSGKMDKDYLYGRGAGDMKAGLAVFMYLTAELAGRVDYKIIFTAVSDEEVGGARGAKNTAERYRPDLVLDCEAGNSRFIGLGEKGILQVRLVTNGISAHGSMPSRGKNAIMLMLDDLKRLSAIAKLKVRAPKGIAEALKNSTMAYGPDVPIISYNPSVINGGVKINVVPDCCEAYVDMRIPPGMSTAKGLRIVRSIVKSAAVTVHSSAEPNYTEPGDPYVAGFVKAAKRYVANPIRIIKAGGTDGRFFRYKGIPTISFGPGDVRTIHAYNERAALKDIATSYKVYRDYMLALPL